MPSESYDLIVIGAGPGGYTAAIRAAQFGMNVACVDKEKTLGGTCLRIGCIPSKALLESSELYERTAGELSVHGVVTKGVSLDLKRMMQRKEKVVASLTRGVAHLIRKNKIKRHTGTARFASAHEVVVDEADGSTRLEAKHVLIATGSSVASLPGVEIDGHLIGDSTTALSYDTVPERLVVIGAGYIGLELGSVWRRLGAKVVVLEYLDRILPGMDAEISRFAQRLFARQGIEFRLGTKVTGAKVDGDRCTVEAEGSEPLEAHRVLVSVGRRPNTSGLDLAAADIEVNDRGQIAVDDHFQTSAPGVYAIGDVIRGPMLAHKAEEEGIACVERIATGYGHVNYNAIPGVVYTHPEIAAVGKSEEDLRREGIPYRKGRFPFVANGRAQALADTDGFVKVLADERTDRVLGVHVIGPRAGELIAEAAVAMEFGASSEDIARCVHAHPTLAETLKEAALGTDGRALHI